MQPRLFQPESLPVVAAPTVRAVIDLYLAHTRHEQEARTYEGRKRHLEAFARVHGEVPIAEAKPWQLRLWVDGQARWRSDWTRKGACGSVQRAFNWALKLGIIDRNPFWGVSYPDGDDGRAMTDEEYRLALRSSSQLFRQVLVFLRHSGCRPGELAKLEPHHIDFDRGIAVLQKHKTLRTQKRRKPRVIVLHAVAQKLLRYRIARMNPGQTRIFLNAKGRPWQRYALGCRMKRLRKRLTLPADCKMYGLRHKFGTDAIKNDLPGGIKTLAYLMGHETTRSTERYVHLDNQLPFLHEALKRAIKP